MPITTRPAPRYWIRKVILAGLAILLGVLPLFVSANGHSAVRPAFAIAGVFIALIELFSLFLAFRSRFTLNENGSLDTPRGRINPSQMTAIKVLGWGDRRLARLDFKMASSPRHRKAESDLSLRLDGWIYRNMDEIINRLNDRLNPSKHSEQTASETSNSGDRSSPVETTIE